MTLSSTILALSPYGWWRCGDASGSVLTDSSGNGRNGSIHGGTIAYSQASLTGDGEVSLGLSGTQAWLTVLSGSSAAPGVANSAFTLGFIYRPTTISNTFLCGGGGGTGGWELVQTGSGFNLTAGANGTTTIGSCTNAAAGVTANGNPILFFLTYDGAGNWQLFNAKSTTPIINVTGQTLTPGSANLVQVGSASNGSASCPGYYQDAMIFNSVLSTANMSSIYTAAVLQNFVSITSTATVTNGATSVALSWTVPSGGYAPFTYSVYRGKISQLGVTGYTLLYTGTATSYTDTSVPDAGLYYYRVNITDSQSNIGSSNLIPGQLTSAIAICAIGDSRTTGANGSGTDPVTDLATVLADLLAPVTVTFSNQGQTGSKTGDWVANSTYLNNALTAFTTLGNALPASGKMWVQISLGVNDANIGGGGNISVAQYTANLQSTIAAIKAANLPKFAGIVLHVTPPCVPYGYNGNYTEATNALVVQYNAALQSLVDNKTVFMGDNNAYDYFSLNYGQLSDGLHPNAAGYVAWATMWGHRYAALAGGAGAAVYNGTTYPASAPLRNIVAGTAYVTIPWAIPAAGTPGATGTAQSGNTSVQVNTSLNPHAADELLNLVDRMIADGRASLY